MNNFFVRNENNEFEKETISIPIQDFFKDMDVIEIGIETGPFFEYAEMLLEVPMVDVYHRGNQQRVVIHSMHSDKSQQEQDKIIEYTIRWMKRNNRPIY